MHNHDFLKCKLTGRGKCCGKRQASLFKFTALPHNLLISSAKQNQQLLWEWDYFKQAEGAHLCPVSEPEYCSLSSAQIVLMYFGREEMQIGWNPRRTKHLRLPMILGLSHLAKIHWPSFAVYDSNTTSRDGNQATVSSWRKTVCAW